MPPAPVPTPNLDSLASAAAIDRFADALWLEHGLSKNTLAAYRRDLSLYARWLAATHGKALDATTEVGPAQPTPPTSTRPRASPPPTGA